MGNGSAKLMILGEAPAYNEERPFTSPSGKELIDYLKTLELIVMTVGLVMYLNMRYLKIYQVKRFLHGFVLEMPA